MQTYTRETLFGVLVAAPIIAFPFARSYLIFHLAIIVAALLAQRTMQAIRTERSLSLGVLALAGPVAVTIVTLGLTTGQIERVWLEKLALILVAGLLGFSVVGLSESSRSRQVASAIIGLTIVFWVFDGLVQLVLGRDLFGIAPHTQSGGERIGAFFSNPYRYGYFLAFLAALPVFWMLSQHRGLLLSALVLATGAAVSLAGGSRYAMLSYGLLFVTFASIAGRHQPPERRMWLLIGAPIGLAVLFGATYAFSPSLQQRVADTTLILQALDRETLNVALSHRLDIWEPALALARDNWLFGIGPSQFTAAIKAHLPANSIYVTAGIDVMHAHQVLLEVLLGSGLIGLIGFVAYYGYVAVLTWRNRDHSTTLGWAALLAFLLMWFPLGSQKDIYGSEQMLLSFYLLGLGYGQLRARQDKSGHSLTQDENR